MEFRVLGDIEASSDGRPIELGGPRQRLLLALLLTQPNEVVSQDRIAEVVWDGEEQPARPARAVQTYVSRLRRALGQDHVLTRKPGYGVLAADADLDADRYVALIEQARDRRANGDIGRALDVLAEAEDLWRGDPWAELGDRYWAIASAERLREVQLSAAALHAELLLDVGDPARALENLRPLLTQYPLAEGLRRVELVALHRLGRDIEASRSFQRFRDRVVSETGLEPSKELSELEARIVRGEEERAHPPTIRGFELLGRLGEGTASIVWRAHQSSLDRDVALKVLRPELADDPEVIRSFERHAKQVAALDHPNLVPLLDAWRDHRGAYIVMPVLETMPVPTAGLGPGAVLRTLAAVGDALGALHSVGVVHGDIVPDDLLVDGERILLGGLGIVGHGDHRTVAEDVTSLGRLGLELLDGASPEAPTLAATLERVAGGDLDTLDDLQRALGQGGGVDPTVPVRNPYKGLAAFDVLDADDFFGRKDIVADIVERITSGPLVAVIGASGSGKSSLVRAGVLPALIRSAELGGLPWFGLTMMPGTDPYEGLEAGLLRLAVNPPPTLRDQLAADERGLLRAAARCLPDDRSVLLLVIDQFEELFTLTDEATREAFLAMIVETVGEPASRVRIVLTLRADLYDRPLAHPTFGELLAGAGVPLPSLTGEELEQAVVGPAQQVGLGFETSVVAELVRAGVSEPSALPLVQFTLTELVDRRRGDAVTADDLAALGGVEGAIARRAEHVHAALPEIERLAARPLFGRLVSVTGGTPTRQRARTAELSDDAAAVVEAFGQARLLSFDRDAETREPTVEVAHESLLTAWPRLRDWLADDTDELRIAGRVGAAAREWEDGGLDDGELLRGATLAAAVALVASRPERFTALEQEFITTSAARLEADRIRERRQYRRARVALTAVAVLLVGALVAGYLAVDQRDDARGEAYERESQRMAFQAPDLVETDPSLALLLAAEAYRRSPSPITTGGLQQVLTGTGRFLGLILAGRSTHAVQWLDDTRLIVVTDQNVEVVDLEENRTVATYDIDPPVIGAYRRAIAAAAPSASRLAVATEPGTTVAILSLDGDAGVDAPIPNRVRSLAFAPDGAVLYVGDAAGMLHEVDAATGRILRDRRVHEQGPWSPPEGFGRPDLEAFAEFSANQGVVALAVTNDIVATSGRFEVVVWDRPDLTVRSRTIGELENEDGTRELAMSEAMGVDSSDPERLLMGANRSVGSMSLADGTQTWTVDTTQFFANEWPSTYVAGSRVAALSLDGFLRIHHPGGPEATVSVPIALGEPRDIALNPEASRVAVTSVEGVGLYAVDDTGLIAEHVDATGDVASVNEGGSAVATASLTDDTGTITRRNGVGWSTEALPEERLLLLSGDVSIPDHAVEMDTAGFGAIRYVDPDTLEPAGDWIPDISYGAVNVAAGMVVTSPYEAALGSDPMKLQFYEVPSGRSLGALEVPDDVRTAGLQTPSGDGRLMLGAVGATGEVLAVDLESMSLVDPPFQVATGVARLALDPSGEHLYAQRKAGGIEVRDARSYELETVLLTSRRVTDENGVALFFDSDRGLLLSLTGNGPQLSDLSTGTPIGGAFPGEEHGAANATEDAPLQLASVAENATRLWNLDIGAWPDIACRAAGRNMTAEEWALLGPADRSPETTCAEWPAPA